MLDISIFVLEKYNTKQFVMNKFRIGIALSLVIVIGFFVFWMSRSHDFNDVIQVSLVLIIVVSFGFVVAFRRFISAKKGEPAEDELSKQILQKAASLSFYVSLYLWLLISYFSHKLEFETEQLIGYGIIGMAIIFVGSWYFFRIKGLNDD